MRLKNLKWWLHLSVVFACLASWGCGGKEPEQTVEIVRPIKSAVVGGNLAGRLSFPGRVQATQRVLLSFRVPGRLITLPIVEGQSVSEGDLVGRLDPTDFEIAVEEARAAFIKSESDFERYRRLYEKEAVPLSDLDLYRAQRDVAKARLDQAQANLGYTFLRAPFSGRLGEKLAENFEDVAAKESIVSLHDVGSIEVVMDVPEYLIASTNEGIDIVAAAVFETVSDREYPLAFQEASAEADPETQTYKVTMVMPQPEDVRILPGMTAQVRLIMEHADPDGVEHPVFTVPVTAVFAGDDGTQFVWIVGEDMTVTRREVEVGEVTGTASIQILGGINAGERIATAAVTRLRDGMEVRLMEE